MSYWKGFFLSLATMAALSLLIGLYRPWVVLWWMERQNRLRVFRLYGSIGLIAFLIYLFLD